jgi:hypothetical protein
MMKHVYRSGHGPEHPSPFIRKSSVLLDQIEPIPRDTRLLLGGIIACALAKAYKLGEEGRSADELATGS